jgi:hypothetical protein
MNVFTFCDVKEKEATKPRFDKIIKKFQGLDQTYPTLVSCQNVQKLCYEIH